MGREPRANPHQLINVGDPIQDEGGDRVWRVHTQDLKLFRAKKKPPAVFRGKGFRFASSLFNLLRGLPIEVEV